MDANRLKEIEDIKRFMVENEELRQELKVCGEAISAVRKGVNQSSLSFDKNLPSEEYGVHMAISRFNLNKITLAEAQPLLSKIMESKLTEGGEG